MHVLHCIVSIASLAGQLTTTEEHCAIQSRTISAVGMSVDAGTDARHLVCRAEATRQSAMSRAHAAKFEDVRIAATYRAALNC